VVLICSVAMLSGCGQKGDPLPPLVRVPVAPADFAAERRGAHADLHFTVPATNTDGTRPANIARVEIYALTGSPTVADDALLKLGTKVASVSVKAPRDPNAVVEPDEPDADVEPLEGSGLDQGIMAHVREVLPLEPGTGAGAPSARFYIAVGISTSGRRGLLSRRVAVALGPAPLAPAKLDGTYDETRVTLTWTPASTGTSYHVYELAAPATPGANPETRLTEAPITEARFVDPRVEWDVERCYAVSSLAIRDGLASESEVSPRACIRMVDTFAPVPPVGLTPVASDGAIDLTWDANAEKDLAGYEVMRSAFPGNSLTVITPAPIQETTFKDSVPSGVRYVYALRAVDKAGNVSAPSPPVEASAR